MLFMRYLLYICIFCFFASSCKTEFEKIRTSNDPQLAFNKGLEYYRAEDYGKARSLFELVIPYYRGKKEAEELFYKFAYCHYYLGEYILASHYFNSFGKTFYNSENREESIWMAAYSNLQLSPNHRLDQSHSEQAIEEFQTFINRFPESERVEEGNRIIDELRAKLELKAFEQGQLYYNLKNYNSSITSFDNMLKDFPDTKRIEEIHYLIIKSSFQWAEQSIYSKRKERYDETIKRYNKFVKKYPKSKFAGELANILRDSQQALKELS